MCVEERRVCVVGPQSPRAPVEHGNGDKPGGGEPPRAQAKQLTRAQEREAIAQGDPVATERRRVVNGSMRTRRRVRARLEAATATKSPSSTRTPSATLRAQPGPRRRCRLAVGSASDDHRVRQSPEASPVTGTSWFREPVLDAVARDGGSLAARDPRPARAHGLNMLQYARRRSLCRLMRSRDDPRFSQLSRRSPCPTTSSTRTTSSRT
jgi:hypothetical protein